MDFSRAEPDFSTLKCNGSVTDHHTAELLGHLSILSVSTCRFRIQFTQSDAP